MLVEKQRCQHFPEVKKEIRVVQPDEKVARLEMELKELRTELREVRSSKKNLEAGSVEVKQKTPRENNNLHGNQTGQNPRGKYGPRRCYFCDSLDHILRDCPHKAAWRQQHKQSTEAGAESKNDPAKVQAPLNF